jgi:hypothetical protein
VITAVFQTETTGRSLEDISPHHRLVPSAASA